MDAGDDADVGAYVRWMAELRGLSPDTVRTRVGVLRRLSQQAGRPLAELGCEDLRAWQATLAVSPASRAGYLSAVFCFYRWLLAEERITLDPTRRLVAPKVPRRRARPIAEDDLALAITAAAEPIRCWLVLSAYAGLRGVEIARLERGDVYTDGAGPVVVVRGKGGRERVLAVSPVVLSALRPHLSGRGPLFRRADGSPVNANIVRLACNRHLHSLGIASTLHKGRARFGTAIYSDTSDIRLTQEVLGHADISTTAQHYVLPSSPAAAAAVLRLGMYPLRG